MDLLDIRMESLELESAHNELDRHKLIIQDQAHQIKLISGELKEVL